MTDRENVARVKPLVWEDHPADDGPVISKAVALHGTYFIVDDTDDFSGLYLQLISHDNAKWWQHVRSTCDTLLEGIHNDDLEPIKAAAQADYEARILASLEPVTVQEAARVLMQDKAARDTAFNAFWDVSQKHSLEATNRAGARYSITGNVVNEMWYAALTALADTGEDG